ncbi:gamma-glutamyltransferase [Sphingomonas sp. ID1715]|uniref:gamma-glutamyltransferase n=1 Tax=Sphingomonas sp. ID1715 TaxID=1656898 RepID=UPI001489CBFB|nr:gamma-glutamyltransferase [Sphingomonas sp. ID1715]NNM77488.1 gamma-glutamyltransferase [Sphingomonas sp. ID1715]
MIARLLKSLLPLALLAGCATASSPPPSASGATGGGAVSAADPRAAAAGQEMLRQGGSAVDAAIATGIALTVVEPQSSGIGGGGFLVVHDGTTGRLTSYDGREVAPGAATPALFLDASGKPLPFGEAVPGGKSVGVPGNIRMWAMAHRVHGKLPWARLFEPAIRLARDGFEITPRMAEFLDTRGRGAGFTPWGRSYFFGPNGEPRKAGETVRNPDLAASLQAIAARGPDSFYVGPAAQALVQTVRSAAKNPSQMTAGDLASYEAKERPVLCGTYRRHRICGMGPPSGFVTMFEILKQLERFDLRALGRDNPEAWHLIAESQRLAYADRDAYMADPDFTPVPAEGLMSDSYLASRSALISKDGRIAKAVAGTPPGARAVTPALSPEPAGTSHMVAVDHAGNVATMTSTIEGPFGSGLTVGGFYLNNELTDFSFAPEQNGAPVANRVEAGKRPRSAMSPTIVYAPDGHVRLALGAAGGATIIAQVAKTIIAVIDWDLPVEEAIISPQLVAMGDGVAVEQGTALEAMIPALQARGHKVAARALPLKGNAVEWRDGQWIGGADRRSEGAALKE